MNVKKFGTFSGVFTPSILTILGVIMFLRLPYLVGQGGFWMVLAVIIVAHVISTTTGLSVASIATDKKVRAGGSYYIISRSLGLPIGGTLGIALFVGMSFSISLYLIGFAESLLDYYPSLANTPANIRIVGTVALVVVAAVTLISTSLALRTQYLIMAAIFLALASVLLGSYSGLLEWFGFDAAVGSPGEIAARRPPAEPLLLFTAGPGFAALFGIFFPAVTGFEAGVSMSGDLKNPRQSIPRGTLGAIAVGFIVYVGLAWFLASRVDGELLREDTGILRSVSIYAPLLAAGVWGATVSSALGSMLGAPRILQAASQDSITPRIFAKGYGPAGEPRAALLLAVGIAWSGIMIGELDAIAEIVSMFFITAYCFLNLSAAFESWASPDFKPDFRVPPYVGVLGALTCLVVMIQLNLLAMLGAFALLGLIWLHLKRKELVLETGDTWEGVYSSVVRRALFRLSRTRVHPRNWRPNMILFSGGEGARPHLIQLARWLADRRGVVSSFELVETGKARLRPRAEQAVPGEEDEFDGVFSRRMECADVYTAMDSIPRYYGFSGLEPNTVLLGRAHGLNNAGRFAGLLETYRKLDYNVMLLDYNHQLQFGNHQSLDIWWSGRGNMLDFALSAARFLLTTPRWNRARTRILVITDSAPRVELIHRHIAATLEQYRLAAEVRVIFNGVEKKSFFDIIARQSRDTDLTMLGMPPLSVDQAQDDVMRMNELAAEMGSLLWLRASGYFQEIYTGSEPSGGQEAAEEIVLPIPHPEWPNQPELAGALEHLYAKSKDNLAHFHESLRARFFEARDEFLESMESSARSLLDRLSREDAGESYLYRRAVLAAHNDFSFQLQKAFQAYRARRQGPGSAGGLEESALARFQELREAIARSPETITLPRPREFFAKSPGDGILTRFGKWIRRARYSGETIPDRVNFRAPAYLLLLGDRPAAMERLIRELNHFEYRFMVELLQSAAGFHAALASLSADADATTREEARKVCLRIFPEMRSALDNRRLALMAEQKGDLAVAFARLARWLDRPAGAKAAVPGASTRASLNVRRLYNEFARALAAENAHNENSLDLYLEMTSAGVALGTFQQRLRSLTARKMDELGMEFHGSVLAPLADHAARSARPGTHENGDETETPGVTWRHPLPAAADQFLEEGGVLNELIAEIQPQITALPSEIRLLSAESLRQLEEGQPGEIETVQVALRQYLEYALESDFMEKAREQLEELDRMVRNASADALARLARSEEDPGDAKAREESQDWTAAIAALKTKGQQKLDRITSDLDRFLEDLGPFALVRKSADMQGFIRSAEQARWRARWQALGRGLRSGLQRFFAALVFGRSQATVLARFIDTGTARESGRMHRMLEAVAGFSPDPARLERIPLYYLHLFTGNLAVNPDFWVGRERELALASRAFAFFERGASGALFVTGPSGCGKSWLSSHVARRHCDSVHEIFPPAEGAVTRAAFREAFAAGFGPEGAVKTPEEILGRPGRMGIVIHDLELFWERRAGGLAIIDDLLELIAKYGGRHFFVINSSSRAYALINKLRGLGDYALGRVICGAFSADQLQRIILVRHGFAGYEFELDGRGENEISGYALARFFHRLFRASSGLPGPALRLWVQSAELVGERRVKLHPMESPRLEVLESVAPAWVMLLEQFLVHKNFTRDRCDAVFGSQREIARRILPHVTRAGLVVETETGVFKLNPYIRHFIAEEFHRRPAP